ncbi:MAG: S-layer homology domain-containing protein, partial [Firmicutes bacterium]|nr:S-layer homology domain-containing protein [Bacillota bacterium]
SPFAYYDPLPQGKVGVDRPVLSVRVVLAEGVPASALSFRMTLDGADVPASFDGAFVTYRPPRPLPPGTHRASVELAAKGWQAELPWSFEVVADPVRVTTSPVLQDYALRALNTYRALAGLPPLVADASLAAAAQAHAAFYARNAAAYGGVSLQVHVEPEFWPGFTGRAPWNRAAYFGYAGNVAEDMAFGEGLVEAVDTWMNSVYHRLPIVDPTLRAAGFALVGAPNAAGDLPVTDLELGDWIPQPADVPSGTVVVYPVDGQTEVPLSFPRGEIPDPLSPFPGASYPTGFPVTLQLPSPHAAALDVDTAVLQTDGGRVVPAYVLRPDDSASDPAIAHLGGTAVAIVPKAPLAPLTTYRVRVTGRYLDDSGAWHPLSRQWSFRTARWDAPQLVSATRFLSGGQWTVRVTGYADLTQAKVYVDGRAVPGVRHPSAGLLEFALPPGTYDAASVLDVVQPNGLEERWPGFLGSGGLTVAGPADWQPVDLSLDGRAFPKGAALSGGVPFLPAALLPAVGAAFVATDDGELVWQDGAQRFAGAGSGGASAAAGGLARVLLPQPPRVENGSVYLPLDVARRVLQAVGQFVAYDPARRLVSVYAWLSDIAGHWAEADVRDLAARGIVHGEPDGLFHPGEPLSRAAFLKMLVAALQVPLRPGDTAGTSVDPRHWLVQQGWFAAAVQAGILTPAETGAMGGTQLDAPASRLEMARWMARWAAAAGQALPAGGAAPFVDLGTLGTADRDLLGRLYAAGLVRGEPQPGGGLAFLPDRAMTRAEAAAVVERLVRYAGRAGASGSR